MSILGLVMPLDETRRRSRWILRVLEWNDSRARYPNLWQDEMPRHVLARDGVACRLRLGDWIAIYYPANPARPKRSEKFVGLSRVSGLRRADEDGFDWIDLETAHRFEPPLAISRHPRRVFLCCDPGWPEPDVQMFEEVFAAAVAGGFVPDEDATAAEREPAKPKEPTASSASVPIEAVAAPEPVRRPPERAARSFAGVDYSGDMRDPRDGTWLAIVELREDALHLTRLEATGRHGLQGFLRDPDAQLMRVEAIGLDFPFGLPLDFAEKLMGRPFPAEGWWALAKTLERLSRPDYLVAVQEFREERGESKRLTDEVAHAFSPLHRVNPDLGPMTYHGIRMIAEDRSRYSVKPFETALGRYLLEVYPGAFVRRMLSDPAAADADGRDRRRKIVDGLGRLRSLPVRFDERTAASCYGRRDALDAVVAARLAAVAVLTGEIERAPDDLAPGQGDRVRREGWIYGLAGPA